MMQNFILDSHQPYVSTSGLQQSLLHGKYEIEVDDVYVYLFVSPLILTEFPAS
jgi:hypothetical protein